MDDKKVYAAALKGEEMGQSSLAEVVIWGVFVTICIWLGLFLKW